MTPRTVAFATSPGVPERFARHALVEGWEHERIARLRVAVLGVGALGNEVVKNLALLGVGHLLLVDKDRIETSNLSRSVLFREGDLGREKAVVAAARAVELSPGLDAVPLVQDIGQDLGPACLEGYDVAVACLDSIDARLRVSRLCRAAGIPWWNGGLGETACELTRFEPADGPCYECTLGDRARRREAARWSCLAPRVELEGRPLPTTAIAAALGGALLASEVVLGALPAFENRRSPPHRRLLLEAAPLRMTPFELPRDPRCPAHEPSGTPRRVPLDHRAPGRRLLDVLGAPGGAELHLGFELVLDWSCGCGPMRTPRPVPARRFAPRCGRCGETTRDVVTTASLPGDHPALALPLRDLGVADGGDLVLATPEALAPLRLALSERKTSP